MKPTILTSCRQAMAMGLFALLLITGLTSCKKEIGPDAANKPSAYSSDVITKWMTLQIRLMKNATGIPNHPFARHLAYTGVTALESIAPGLPARKKWDDQWNGLTDLPTPNYAAHYYYPANANAALAAINRAFFPNASVQDKAAIDSLESALYQEFSATENASHLQASAQYGKNVAAAVFHWAETDGYKDAGNAYTPPAGDGLWVATPPAFANAITPYWSHIRTIINGSTTNTQPPAPPAYSTDPTSDFYTMVKQVYDASQMLTDEQKATVYFWRDVPGVSTPGHWLSITKQIIEQRSVSLEKAAVAYALIGTAVHDAIISCFQTKYHFNLVRPVTYIRNVMGYSSWTSFIGTPAHPEYSSAHAVFSSAASEVLQQLFGDSGNFTDHTYDYLGYAPRSFSSFNAMAEEGGNSRFYAGIHYQPSVNAGLEQGRKVAVNVLTAVGLKIKN